MSTLIMQHNQQEQQERQYPPPAPAQAAPERRSTNTKSQEEELQQIEADLEQEKIHSLRNRLDNLLGSLVQPAVAATSSIPTVITTSDANTVVSNSNLTNNSSNADDYSVAGTIATTQTQSSRKTNSALLQPGRVWVTDPYGDQGQYKGGLDDNSLPHGIGDMIYMDGRQYKGGWKHGHWHGEAKAKFQNGDVFRGTYQMDQRHGPGSYHWSDGRSFVGDFHQDQRHGRGEFRWPDSSCYVGQFKKGHRHGYGNYKFPDGSVYEGHWRKSQMHGQGECRWADKRIYSGEWKEGKAHGLGKETRPDGTVRHDGLWEQDKPIREQGTSSTGTTTADADRGMENAVLATPSTPLPANDASETANNLEASSLTPIVDDYLDPAVLEAAAEVIAANEAAESGETNQEMLDPDL